MEEDDKERNSTPYKTPKPTKRKSQTAFLAAYEECGNITAAAKMADMDRKNHYKWLKEDDSYLDQFEAAHQIYVDNMEAEARRRAVEGTEVPIYYMGRQVGHKKIFSDTLLIFLLKGELPDKYKERGEQEVKHSGQITKNDLSSLSIEELERIAGMDVDEDKPD